MDRLSSFSLQGETMIIKIQAVTASAYTNQHNKPRAKYYPLQTLTKSKVKKDFQIKLDTELDKLRFDKLI